MEAAWTRIKGFARPVVGGGVKTTNGVPVFVSRKEKRNQHLLRGEGGQNNRRGPCVSFDSNVET